MKTTLASLLLLSTAAICAADEYHIEKLDTAIPADEVSKEIAAVMSPTGFKVMRSETSTLCEIWFRKDIPVKADFKPSSALLYPFTAGEVIGVIRYRRRGADFRDRDIDRGYYTIRYQLQPIDGNHVGTSVTRDFLLLVNAENDETTKPLDFAKLAELSAEAAQASHPAIISLMKLNPEAKTPSVYEHGDDEWKVVQLPVPTVASDKKASLPISFVIEGAARE